MGDVANDAAHLSKHGNRVLFRDHALMVSAVFKDNLNEHNPPFSPGMRHELLPRRRHKRGDE